MISVNGCLLLGLPLGVEVELIERVGTEPGLHLESTIGGFRDFVVAEELLHPGTVVGVQKGMGVILCRVRQVDRDGGQSHTEDVATRLDKLDRQSPVLVVVGEPQSHRVGPTGLAEPDMIDLGLFHYSNSLRLYRWSLGRPMLGRMTLAELMYPRIMPSAYLGSFRNFQGSAILLSRTAEDAIAMTWVLFSIACCLVTLIATWIQILSSPTTGRSSRST